MICECGKCDLEVKPGNRFIYGHNMIGKKRPEHSEKMKIIMKGKKHWWGLRGESTSNWIGGQDECGIEKLLNYLEKIIVRFVENLMNKKNKKLT
jgi:hypothetical protein